MSPDGDEKSFIESIRFWLYFLAHCCFICGRPIIASPFVECQRCYARRETR